MWWFAAPRGPRVRSHARWLKRATIAFVLPALLALLALGRIEALWAVPPEFAALANALPRFPVAEIAPAIASGMAGGAALIALRIAVARRRRRPLPVGFVFATPLSAARPAELLPASATAIWAGVSEELAFRLALPLLIAILTGSALAGFVIATGVFVALHRYQPWPLQVGVGLVALLLAALYLSTGALWLAMAVHAAMDLLGMVVRPWLAGFRA